jgi:hypothetical protein
MIVVIVGQQEQIDGRQIVHPIYVGSGKTAIGGGKWRCMTTENWVYENIFPSDAKQVGRMAEPD